jgi:trehalose/maltose hydrolase-like predicted phosphorylase
VRETQLQLAKLAQTESLFALANGRFGIRGNLDEGEPFGLPGTYLGGFCEIRHCRIRRTAMGTPRPARPW